jgi:predicted RNA polymerase sigma factor
LAISDLDAALAISRLNVKWIIRRCQCLENIGKYNEALSEFKRARVLDKKLEYRKIIESSIERLDNK